MPLNRVPGQPSTAPAGHAVAVGGRSCVGLTEPTGRLRPGRGALSELEKELKA
jgi:hypothetical protein